jgi:hypothetical protein
MNRRAQQVSVAGRQLALNFVWNAAIFAASSMGACAAQANTVEAVRPAGPGVLTKHFDWLITTSQRSYHHIRLPDRIAVGDKFSLSFGSNTKTYTFSVAQIILKGNHCEIYSQSEVGHRRDKIDVVPCYAADHGH